jgi:Type IV secretion system pilin
MTLIPPLPPWHPPAALAVPGLAAGHLLAAASIGQVINNTTGWIVGILAGLATLFLTIGGVRYLMAGGDPAEVEKAKAALRSAAIGYGLAILAPVIVTVLRSLVGG